MMEDHATTANRISSQASEVSAAAVSLADKTKTPQLSNIITLAKGKLANAIAALKTASEKPASNTGRDNEIRDAKTEVAVIIDEIVSEIDAVNRAVKRVTDSTRALSTATNQLKLDVDPSDNVKKEQTKADKKTMLVEARKALRKGILTEEFADLKAGVTPRDFADVTYVYLSQSWRAYNTDDAMNSALVAAMMIGGDDPSGETRAGDVYQPYLMDTLPHRQAIMKFMGDNDSAGNVAVEQVDMQWREHFKSSAAEEARRGADEIRELKIRLADTEAKLRNVQNNVFDRAMEMAAKMQNALNPAQKKN